MELSKAMIIIAVSRYSGGYRDLPGAVTSARRMEEWALQEGYSVLYLGDDAADHEIATNGIGVELLRQRIKAFLDITFIDRLMVYFAGHGVMTSPLSEFWLLSGASQDRREAVDVAGLVEGLSLSNLGGSNQHGIAGQLCLIGDACREFDSTTSSPLGDAIVTWTKTPGNPQLDRFLSSQRGRASFHIDATPTTPAHCLFSDVMIEALWGRVHEAIDYEDHRLRPVVTNASLATYLEQEVAQRAAPLGGGRPLIQAAIRPPYNDYKRLTPGVSVPAAAATVGPPFVPVSQPPPLSIEHILAARSPGMALAHMHLSLVSPFAIRNRASSLRRLTSRRGGFPDRSTPDDPDEMPLSVFFDRLPTCVALPVNGRVRTVRARTMWAVCTSQFDGVPMLVPFEKEWLLLSDSPGVVTAVTREIPTEAVLFRTDKEDWQTGLIALDADYRGTYDLQARADALAADFEREGYALPHQAVAAGYLYHYLGQRERVLLLARQLARQQQQEPGSPPRLPFDLALLCAKRIEWHQQGERRVAYADLTDAFQEGSEDGFGFDRYSVGKLGLDNTQFRQVPLRGALPALRPGWSILRSARFDVPADIAEIAKHVSGGWTPKLSADGIFAFLKAFNYHIVDLNGDDGAGVLHQVPMESAL